MTPWTALFLVILADPASPGPYNVGARTYDVPDPKKPGRTLKTEVWYPTRQQPNPNADRPPAVALSVALRDAAPAEGPFPCVLFSHGLMAVREQSCFITEHLASHGYIVVSPDHPSTSVRHFQPSRILESALERPRDMSMLLDWLLAQARDPSSPFFGKVRGEKVAAAGHSFGGYTALALGGASVATREAVKRFGRTDLPPEIDLGDQRVRAVIAYAPEFRRTFDPSGIARLVAPTLVFAGTVDQVTPLEKHQAPIFEHLGGPAYLAVIRGGTHYSFNNDELSRMIQLLVKNNPQIARAESDPMVLGVTTAFLARHLLGSEEWADLLEKGRPKLEIKSRNLPVRDRRAARGYSPSNSVSQ